MANVNLFLYSISGHYLKGDQDTYFNDIVEAPNNEVAVRLVLGDILLTAGAPVTLKRVHYEVV